MSFIARGAHLQAMQERGLRVTGPKDDILIDPVAATDDPATLGPVDVVLFTVKLYDTESAGELIRPMVGDGTVVITLQNGVDGAERLSRLFGEDRVMAGTAYIFASITEPGVVTANSEMASIAFGEPDGRASDRAKAFQAACEAAGFGAKLSEDIQVDLWSKFVLVSTNAGLTSLTRLSLGPVYRDPALRALAQDALAEVAAVGRARGVNLPDDVVERSVTFADNLPPDLKTSMQRTWRTASRSRSPA